MSSARSCGLNEITVNSAMSRMVSSGRESVTARREHGDELPRFIEQSVSGSRDRDLLVPSRFRRHVIAFEVRNKGVTQPGFQFVQPWKDSLLAAAMKVMGVDGDRNPDRENHQSPAAPHDRFAN